MSGASCYGKGDGAAAFRKPRENLVKNIAILPTLLTLGNGVCGFAAIAYASKIGPHSESGEIDHYFVVSACLILAAMVFDVLDGYAARLSKTASEFGGQLDSLCDAISFGVAPAFVLLRLGMDWMQPLVRQAVALIAALYVVCAVLRLARFNMENTSLLSSSATGGEKAAASPKRFKGLPSPAAAGCVISLAILRSTHSGIPPETLAALVRLWAPLGALTAALLMVSRVPYPHITKQILRGRRSFSVLVQVVLALFLIALVPSFACFLLFWGYTLSGLLRHVLYRTLRSKSPLTELGPNREPSIRP
jgi:CDP-diacylglycerol--serine O-phosphatidyltransferase